MVEGAGPRPAGSVMIDTMARRPQGTGSLQIRKDSGGREIWYGHWRANGRQVRRRIGLKRPEGTRQGLTRVQAEERLRELISETRVERRTGEPMTVGDVAKRYRATAERKGRKRSTLQDLETQARVHIEPFFGDKQVAKITAEDVQDFVGMLEAKELAPKTIRNIVGTLSAFFNFAKLPRNRWAAVNPCEGVEILAPDVDHDVRFLTLDELDALIAHARPRDPRQPVDLQALDRVLYRVAAMTGLRQGELLALRWMDVDWLAGRVRVRQNYVRGEYGTPKSRRSVRSVPMADEVARALEGWSQVSVFTGDDDLVFCNPGSGEPLSASKVTKRMQAALAAAGLDDRRYVFHDLRHTFGTRMASAGAPLVSIKAWMGHRSIETTLIYADWCPSGRDAEIVAAAFRRDTEQTKEHASRKRAAEWCVFDAPAEPVGGVALDRYVQPSITRPMTDSALEIRANRPR
jgi:integrase